MRIGVVTETKPAEHRVGLTPAGAAVLADDGHEVLVESGAGVGAGFPDEDYVRCGARTVDRDTAWRDVELVVKVKEPVAAEYHRLREDVALFTYLHLAAEPDLVTALLRARTTAIAYETVEDARGGLPLLAPMSEIAGRLAAHAAAHHLLAPAGGPGLLIGGSPGVEAARVLVLGGGIVGTQAAATAVGMRAEVTVLEVSPDRIRALDEQFGGRVRVLASDPEILARELAASDVVIGAVLVPGASAPTLVRAEDLARMRPGALIVDVAVDQGGCFATSRPTTYLDPTYVVDGVTHYCVANMPGATPRTSTRALTHATLPRLRRLAACGVRRALADDPGLARGLNTAGGEIRHEAVAASLDARAARPVPPLAATPALAG